MSDWAEERANEVMAKWYGTDPDEPGEGPTNAMLLAYIAQALREARKEGMREAAKMLEAREADLTKCSGNTYWQEVECNVMARAIRKAASGEDSKS